MGYSCRSLSAQNPNPKSILDKNSSSGEGFHASTNYIRKSPNVQWTLLENVRQMTQTRHEFDGECPIEIQTERMAKMGFRCCFATLLNSCNFGLAQSRTRSWTLYVREDHCRQEISLYPFGFSHLSTTFVRTALDGEMLLRQLRLAPLSVEHFLQDELDERPEPPKVLPGRTGKKAKWNAQFVAWSTKLGADLCHNKVKLTFSCGAVLVHVNSPTSHLRTV